LLDFVACAEVGVVVVLPVGAEGEEVVVVGTLPAGGVLCGV
jgi:hypothetical protein